MIATHPFGSTGHLSTRTIFGAAALARVTQDVADSTLALVEEHGINHFDTAASYGDSEPRLAPWLKRNRDRVFLATKTGERTYAGARDQIRRSLERLGVAHVDLIQLHNLVDEEQWEIALGKGGALEAAVEARDAGLVRFIGVTGHGVQAPLMHHRSLERFPFDSVLAPYNFPMMRNPRYAADFEALVAACQTRGVAVQTIKAITLAPWAEGAARTASTWYEPLRDQAEIDLAAGWVLGRPGLFLNTVGDVSILPLVLDAAERNVGRPTDQQMAELVRRRQMAPMFT